MGRRFPSARALALSTAAIVATCAAPQTRAMDRVRQTTHTDAAVAMYGVTGHGVIIAILDRGIDWKNTDFIKPDGTTRILGILDMTGQNLCDPGNPPPVFYSAADINAALAGGPPIAHRDAIGHGTATAGVAAGNGRGLPSKKYRGIAPEADLVIVKVVSEGAAAHDGQPAEASFQGCATDALAFVDQLATKFNEPVVALINSGTQWGPIDGTSAISRKIDLAFDKPGRIYVQASGDEGGLANHAGGAYSDTADTVVGFTKASDTTVDTSMWYTGALPAEVTVTFADGTKVGPVGPGGTATGNGVTVIQYDPGNAFYPWQSTSSDRAVFIQATGHAGGGSVILHGMNPGAGHFDAYGDETGPNLTAIVTFNDHLVTGRLDDYASTTSAIVVGDHVNRTSYVDVDGTARDLSNEGLIDHLWYKSSGGPTRDNRLGIDLTAPGQNLFTTLAAGSYFSTFRFNLVQDGGGTYVRFGGTSGSAPIVAGAVALMLQGNPGLTTQKAHQILHATAVTDAFTGVTPNNDWGHGKLDVLAAVAMTQPAGSSTASGSGTSSASASGSGTGGAGGMSASGTGGAAPSAGAGPGVGPRGHTGCGCRLDDGDVGPYSGALAGLVAAAVFAARRRHPVAHGRGTLRM